MPLSIQERLDFISGLNLKVEAENLPQLAAAFAGFDGESASVCAGSAISFVSQVSGQMKEDVLYSTLFAQLAANYKWHRMVNTDEWYAEYRRTLEKIGWTVQCFDMVKLDDVSKYNSVDILLMEHASSSLSEDEVALFRSMLYSLKDWRNHNAMKHLTSWSTEYNRANFQTGVVVNSGGNPVFKIGTYVYTAAQQIDNVLFFEFGSQKVTFYVGNQDMILNTAIYETFRDWIISRLTEIDIVEIELVD